MLTTLEPTVSTSTTISAGQKDCSTSPRNCSTGCCGKPIPGWASRRRSSLRARNYRLTFPMPQTSFQRSEEHTSELQSLMRISYAVFCLKKKKQDINNTKFTYRYH